MKDKFVCVEWEDASFVSGYYDKREPGEYEPILTKTVGHLVYKTAKAVIVAQDNFYDPKGELTDSRHLTIIPKKMIKQIIMLHPQENLPRK